MFGDTFIEGLPDNPELAGKEICDEFFRDYESLNINDEIEYYYDEYLKAFAILQEFSEANGIEYYFDPLTGELSENIQKIINAFNGLRSIFDKKFTDAKLDQYKNIFKHKFENGFYYEFTDGDLKRIQRLITELRENISISEELEDDHKSRLLKKLEKLQAELNKKMSDLDKFWGLLIEGSIAMKKVGENIKPIVDRIQEIANIVWGVQTRAEELPSNIPLGLPGSEKEE